MIKKHNFLNARRLALLAVLMALCVVGRLAFQFIPNVQPITTLLILITLNMTWLDGWIVAIGSMVLTNIFLGMGPWTIAQIIAYSIVILFVALVKMIVKKSQINQQSATVIFSLVSFFVGFFYGFIVSILTSFMIGITNFWIYYFQGVSFDLMHAIGNFFFYILLAPVMNPLFKKMKQTYF